MTYPHLPYAITEGYCIIFAATVWLRLNSNLGSEHEVRQLRNMIYSYLGMLATDLLWALAEDGLIHPPRLLYAFINAITVISIACGCYFWFRFIEDRLHFARSGKKGLYTLLTIPLLVVCLLDLISVFTGWLFYIDAENHYQSTPLFWFHTVVNYFYLLIPTGFSIYRAIKTQVRQERSEYLTYALYMIAPLIAGLLEDVFPLVPLLGLSIFMMILILFLMIQNMQVYNDALTGLNNRRRLNQYLEDRLSKASPSRPLLLFIMDINSFKSINDVYGHLEGDHALRFFSGVLKEIAIKHYAFAARYGGDEFCMVMDAAGRTPEEIAAAIHHELQNAQNAQAEKAGKSKAYTLTVSIGYAVCDGADNAPDAVLAKADRLLYENKKAWHISGSV